MSAKSPRSFDDLQSIHMIKNVDGSWWAHVHSVDGKTEWTFNPVSDPANVMEEILKRLLADSDYVQVTQSAEQSQEKSNVTEPSQALGGSSVPAVKKGQRRKQSRRKD